MSKRKIDNKLLASLAVFRSLYDSKKDVSIIISDFVQDVIISNGIHRFNIKEIANKLNKTFDFNLPESIIEASLKNLQYLEKNKGFFIVNKFETLTSIELNNKKEKIEISNNLIIHRLFDYIADKQGKLNNKREEEQILASLCSFLMDDSVDQKYHKDISAFYILNNNDYEFSKQLDLIKEGVVLYTGIKYSSNVITKGAWSTRLTIFIDTEILFYFAGFDGKIQQSLFSDLLDYVKQINKNKELIKLLYFEDVESEIDRFFAKAEQIINGYETLDPSRAAMASICNGCKSPSDIIIKREEFFELLIENNIKKDDYEDYYTQHNHEYNITDTNTIEVLNKSIGRGDVTENMRFLNFINIHRQNDQNENFENIGAILLTGNTTTQRVAWHKSIKNNGNVPLATNINFLTTKFWFKLNRGFGGNDYPTSFGILTKSQMILSAQLNESVNIQYKKVQEKSNNNELSEKVAIASIASLRSQVIKPEEIEQYNLDSILDSISDQNIERYILEQELLKDEIEKGSLAKEKLENDLSSKDKQLIDTKENNIILSDKINLAKTQLLKEKNISIAIIEDLKKPIDKDISNSYRNQKIILILFVFVGYAFSYYLIVTIGWDILEQWTWIASTIPVLFYLLFLLIKEKTFNPLDILNARKNKIQTEKYNHYNIDTKLLIQLKIERDELEKELKK